MGREGERVRLGEVGAGIRGAVRGFPAALQAVGSSAKAGVTTLLPGEAAQGTLPFQSGNADLVSPPVADLNTTYRDLVGNVFTGMRGMRDALISIGDILNGVEGAPTFGAQYSPAGHIPNLQFRGRTVLPLGGLARAPSRMVASVHSLFRVLNYSIDINQQAYRSAANDGLTGNALYDRIGQLRQSPTPEMMASAADTASDLTLMGQAGPFMKKVSALFNWEANLPLLGETQPLKFIDPFVHIASQVAKKSIGEQSPLGLLSSEIRADLAGKNGNVAQDMATAKMLVGSVLGMTFGGLAAEGLVSGSGPTDKNKAAIWRMAGNQAHSVRIGDIWYDIHRLGPLGVLLSTAADMYDVAHLAEEGDMKQVAASFMHAVSQNFLDEGFLKGPSDLLKAVEDSGRYGGSYVSNFLSDFLPYSVGLGQFARAGDPCVRQARTIMDSIKAKIPGLSETLLPRRDIWGEPMPNHDALIAPGVTAIYESQMSRDPVNRAMLDLNMSIGPVGKRILNVPLNPQEYDDYARIAGRMTKSDLDRVINSPSWEQIPLEGKRAAIQHIVEMNRRAAEEMMKGKYPHIPADATLYKRAKARGEQP
jgi:hypothetical protein